MVTKYEVEKKMERHIGKYSLPGWICAGFFIALLLSMTYELLLSSSAQRNCKKSIDIAIQHLIDDTIVSNSGAEIDPESQKRLLLKFHKYANDDLNSLGNRTTLITYLFLFGCSAIFFLFFAWSYFIRNKELGRRLDLALSRREEVDELGLAAAGLAHETKNPLGVIRGLAQNIANKLDNSEETRRKARDIMEETDLTTARLGDFLSYARFRSPTPEDVNSVEYLERIISLIEDDFKNSGVELNSEITPLTMIADSDMLSQVLMNLLTNSLRFTKKGEMVTLSCNSAGSQFATLAVTDTGSGIDSKMLPNIFKPYVTKGAGGYGIGLAIVKRIVEQAGWKISVKSKPEKGTTITISKIAVRDI